MPAQTRSQRANNVVVGGKTPPRRRTSRDTKGIPPPPQGFYFGEDDAGHKALMQPRWKVCKKRCSRQFQSARRKWSCTKKSKPVVHRNIETNAIHQKFTDTTSAKEEDDPLVGLSLRATSFERSVSVLPDVSTLGQKFGNESRNEQVTPHVKMIRANMGPDDEHIADIMRNTTEDSVLMAALSSEEDDSELDNAVKAAQFQPIYRENRVMPANPYAQFQHSPGKYVQSLVDRSNSSTVDEDEARDSLSVEPPAASQVEPESPVVELFTKDGDGVKKPQPILNMPVISNGPSVLTPRSPSSASQDMSMMLKRRMTGESTLYSSDDGRKIALPFQPYENIDMSQIRRGKTEIQSVPSIETNATEPTVVNDRHSESKENKVTEESIKPSLPTSKSRISETSKTSAWSAPATRTQRLSQESNGVTSAASAPPVVAVVRRQGGKEHIEVQVQHLDPKGSRIARVREQYQRDVKRIAANSPANKSLSNSPRGRSSERRVNSLPTTVKQSNKSAQSQRKSTGAPSGHRRRQSIEIPGLLHMAGWREPPKNREPEKKKASILKTRMDNKQEPPVEETKQVGTTNADMLVQTYTVTEAYQKELKDNNNTESRKSDATSQKDYRLIAMPMGSPPAWKKKQVSAADSPCLSVESSASTGTAQMVSDEALANAAFLFSPSYAQGNQELLEKSRRSSVSATSSLTISTLGSHTRVHTSVESAPVPAPVSKDVLVKDETESITSSQCSQRKVRFSDATDVISIDKSRPASAVESKSPNEVEIAGIDRKLSDLSESSFGYNRGSVPSAGSIEMIPEEVEEEEEVSGGDLVISQENESVVIFDDEHEPEAHPPVMQWTYSMDNGVTPLRKGKSAAHATNSPYVRFQEARTMFSTTKGEESEEEEDEEDELENIPMDEPPTPSPKKKFVPKTKGNGLVFERVSAMESIPQTAVLGMGGVLKPAASEVSSVYSGAINSILATKGLALNDTDIKRTIVKIPKALVSRRRDSGLPFGSPTFVNGRDVAEETPYDPRTSDASSRGVASYHGVGRDVMRGILQPDADETSSQESSVKGQSLSGIFRTKTALGDPSDEDSEDDFDELLNYQQRSMDVSSVDDETVSTIRQDRNAYPVLKTISSDTSDTVTTVRQQRQSMEPSSSGSSVQIRSKFREGNAVRPNEQNIHPRDSVLVNKGPPARTWRELAAKHQQNQGKPRLSLRNVNVVGH